uniref:Sushi, von Willebrand factor type A, EGF and pentraxin domain-containing protein 1 n=2 Tax=Dendroctonus ponderosae TaxID=77166 RepID=A0AAR5P549_DENPD
MTMFIDLIAFLPHAGSNGSKMNLNLCIISVTLWFLPGLRAEKLNLDALNNYSEFLNFGDKKLHKIGENRLENAIFKSKLDVLGEVFKKHVDFFKVTDKLDIVFLVDASSSVGDGNFKSELKFIKKLLSDITVDYNHTRVAVVTFSSPTNTIKNIDDISDPSKEYNKCLLLNDQLMKIEYKGGETYTIGAFAKAKGIFDHSLRNDSKKVIFLVTDGYSNGENPVPLSNELKRSQITIFTIGMRNGNYKELYDLSSTLGQFYSYLLDSFKEFESLARRALHDDLSGGDYLPLGVSTPCDKLCEAGNCCDKDALCACGTTTGHYSCTCKPGFYGSGLRNDCLPCTPGTYSDGPNLCLPCPDVHHTTILPAQGIDSCICKKGFQSDGTGGCQILKCPKISAPQYGYIVKKKECSNVLNSACGLRCEVGYTLVGSSIRLCQENATWTGSDPTCEVKTCNHLPTPKYGSVKCEQIDLDVVYDSAEKNLPVDTVCNFQCENGTVLIGSTQRTCLPIEFGKTCKIICNDGFKAAGSTVKTCGNHGFWGRKQEENTVCTDSTPRDLECPQNISASAVPGTNYGQVSWIEPNITDNSGLEVSTWLKQEYKFSIGLTPVTYFAQDPFYNAIKCKFFVEILAKDPSGNLNICNLNITVEESECPEFTPPSHGRSECADQSESRQCVITCEEGYAIPLQSSEATSLENSSRFECNHAEALWHNTEGLLYPECSVTVVGDQTQEGDVQVSLDGDGCNNTDQIGEIQNSIKSMISNNICTGLCEIDLKSECEVEKSNKLLSRRRRRDSTGKKLQSLQRVPHKNSRARQRKRNRLNVKFQVRGRYLNESKRPDLRLETHNSSVKLKNAKFVCPEGFIPRKNRCAKAQSVNSTECIPTSKGICALTPDVCNHGKCVVVNEYEFSCECLPGFVGKCTCLEGYSGPNCQKIDYCTASKCENGGKCISKETSFMCSCSKLYEGDFCQFKRETNYMLNFSRYDTNDFIRLRGFEINLTEVRFLR